MNFIEEYKKGQSGGNKGLYMGDGLISIHNAINGVQRGRIYGIGAAPKVGKSTFVDYGFVINPVLDAIEKNIDISIHYLSYELDRISKEFDFAAFFLHHDYGLTHVRLPAGITKKGEPFVELSANYLRGRILDDESNLIPMKPVVFEALKKVYEKRIIPFFGEYSSNGLQISPGFINFNGHRDNPTGIYKHFLQYAETKGKFTRVKAGQGYRLTGYVPDNPQKYEIIVTDHLRKLLLERGWFLKQTVDKYIEYSVEIRNLCGFTFAHIIHLNRSMTNIERLKSFTDILFPNSDDIKDTGNLAEDADYLFTMFNPNDKRYNLDKHFGTVIRDKNKNPLFPYMKTVHLVESRHCDYPQHFRVNMLGGLKTFEKF